MLKHGIADIVDVRHGTVEFIKVALGTESVWERDTLVPATITLLGSDVDLGNLATYDFTSKTLGTAASDRYIAAVFAHSSNNSARTVSSCTLGGETAVVRMEKSIGATRTAYVAIAIALVAAGTSGTLSITWDAALAHQTVFWYEIHGIGGTTPSDDMVDTGNPIEGAIDVAAGGVVVSGTMTSNAGGANSHSWSGLTDDGDLNSDVVGANASAGHGAFASAATGHAIDVTADNTPNEMVGLAVAFSP